MAKRKSRSARRLKVFIALVGIIVIAGVIYAYTKPKPKISPTPTSTITSLPSQPASNNGEKKNQSSTSANKGNATDNQGQVSTPITTSPSQWLSSASGVIIVKQPISGGTIKSGAELAGTAKAAKVQYRLIDNQAGVISEGFINVVGGNFSANVNFTSHGSSGRLDVFTSDDNGVESNEVQVPVNF